MSTLNPSSGCAAETSKRSFFQDWNLSTIREIRTLLASQKKERRAWAGVKVEAERIGYLRRVQSTAWNALSEQARAELRARRNDVAEMEKRQTKVAGILARNSSLKTSLESNWVPVNKQKDWSTIRDGVADEFKKRKVHKKLREKLLKRFRSFHPREARKQLFRVVTSNMERLDKQMQVQLASKMGATLALAIARFNAGIETKWTDSEQKPGNVCREVENWLQAAEREIWSALRAEDTFAAKGHGTDLARQAARTLFDCILPLSSAIAAKRESDKASFSRDGRLALRLGGLTRDLLRAIALGQAVTWVAGWPGNASATREWTRRARRLKFPTKVKQPRLVPVADLATNNARWDGKEITIEGVLGAVQIVHRRRKVISSASVSDARGRSVIVEIPYIKLDSGGIAPGSYVRLSGTWQEESRETHGPALRIDRRNFGELAKASWSDWATMQIRGIYETVPHGLAARWSWQPGAKGAGNPLIYGTWFDRTARKPL